MAFSPPIGDLDLDGRSERMVEEDQKRFQRLLQYMPNEQDLRKRVVAFLKSQQTESLEDSLGNPNAIAEHLAELMRENGRDVDVSQLREDLQTELQATIDTGSQRESSLLDEFIADEVVHAKTEFVRCWVETLLMAWSMWGKPTRGLILDEFLLPDASRCRDVPPDWTDALEDARDSLRATVALSTDDIASIAQSFCGSLGRALNQGSVELPDVVDISLDDNNRACLKARTDGARRGRRAIRQYRASGAQREDGPGRPSPVRTRAHREGESE